MLPTPSPPCSSHETRSCLCRAHGHGASGSSWKPYRREETPDAIALLIPCLPSFMVLPTRYLVQWCFASLCNYLPLRENAKQEHLICNAWIGAQHKHRYEARKWGRSMTRLSRRRGIAIKINCFVDRERCSIISSLKWIPISYIKKMILRAVKLLQDMKYNPFFSNSDILRFHLPRLLQFYGVIGDSLSFFFYNALDSIIYLFIQPNKLSLFLMSQN